MLDVCLLGTGGTMPLPGRALTSLMVKYNGKSFLIDCGEGTQIAIREKGWSMKPIDVVFFTHCHADHIAGLPGFLLTMGKMGRVEPVQLVGPRGIRRYIEALCSIVPGLPYDVRLLELSEKEVAFSQAELQIDAFAVDHSVPCYGYSFHVSRAGKFQLEKAQALGLEKRYWGLLQRGETVQVDGRTYTPDMVLGPERKGLHVTYCTDTRPTESIVRHAEGADLFICEGMYGDEEKMEKALENRHMMCREAAALAKRANVRELWLTHYSPSMANPKFYLKQLQKIFPATVMPAGGQSVDLCFSEA